MAVQYNPGIVTDGLVLYLDAANRKSYSGTGTGWADILNTSNGTLLNGATYQNNNSGTINFDGSDDVILIPNNLPFQFVNTQPFSINAWVKWENTTGQFGSVLAFAQTSGPGYYFTLDAGGIRTNAFFFDYWDGGPFRGIQGNENSILQNVWINLTATSGSNSANDMKVYQNGILTSYTVRSDGAPNTVDYSGSNLQIGARGSSSYFKGNIAQVSMYNKVLSPQEIQQNFNALRGRFGI